jgi:nitrite reductase (NADH) small subunit
MTTLDTATLIREQRGEGQLTSSDWVEVCELEDIIPGTGVAALVRGEQIALVRPRGSGEVYALSNYDPFSKAYVLARGIVGDKGGITKIASPIYKQNFALDTGECLDDATVKLPTYPARVRGGKVEVAVSRGGAAK